MFIIKKEDLKELAERARKKGKIDDNIFEQCINNDINEELQINKKVQSENLSLVKTRHDTKKYNSVTRRVSDFKQPRGGYVKVADFNKIIIDDGIILNENENINAGLIGLTVEYMSKFLIGISKDKAFKISLLGAEKAELFDVKNAINISKELLDGINGVDDTSIINACKLTSFDVWLRSARKAKMVNDYKTVNPDKQTIDNIRNLINRTNVFFNTYGPVIKEGFTFEPVQKDVKKYKRMIVSGDCTYGGYTQTVSSGDGDFLTRDTIWDLKVLKSNPTSKHTLQLLMYWIMGQHSGQEIFKSIRKIGVFNPRHNTIFLIEVDKISNDIISVVENEIICY